MGELIRRLMRPALPADTRYRLRQQGMDAEIARRALRVLGRSDVLVGLRRAVPGHLSPESFMLCVARRPGVPLAEANTMFSWSGEQLLVFAEGGAVARLSPRPASGGVLPGFGAHEVAAARCRPMTSGECPALLAEVAAVAFAGGSIRRVYFLDEESRELTSVPADGLSEEKLAGLAAHIGVPFRVYSFRMARRFRPQRWCEVLFPPSARRHRLVNPLKERGDWRKPWP
jgi:hypothetical protein